MKLQIEEFFDHHTMSVHLRENQPVYAKRGRPGEWSLVPLSEEILTYDDVAELADEILEYCDNNDDGMIEDDWEQARIIQLRNFRIVITTPPFADALEITAVKPTMQKSLESYSISQKLFSRLTSSAEGILIAGAPGAGKSTFGAALASFYANQEKIVKTIEKPRDLSVDERITQYTMLDDNPEKTGDILLLMRPDYVIYDEVRKSRDFEVFSDLRLSGIGLIGVVHATKPIDAIQRFVSRIELGMIPSIIDTVIFIDKGEIGAVLSLKMTVKVPSGMRSGDLARPVVVVSDFLNQDRPVYEMFTFGEQIVVVPLGTPLKGAKEFKSINLDEIKNEISYFLDTDKIEIEQIGRNTIRVYLPQPLVKTFIGKRGNQVREFESMFGVSIDVESLKGKSLTRTQDIGPEVKVIDERKHLVLSIGSKYGGRDIDLIFGSQIIMTVTVDFSGHIRLSKKKGPTKKLMKLLQTSDYPLTFRVRE